MKQAFWEGGRKEERKEGRSVMVRLGSVAASLSCQDAGSGWEVGSSSAAARALLQHLQPPGTMEEFLTPEPAECGPRRQLLSGKQRLFPATCRSPHVPGLGLEAAAEC